MANQKQRKDTGWIEDWQLYETPASRRLDLHMKTVAVLLSLFLAAYTADICTLAIERLSWWAVFAWPAIIWAVFALGPPGLPAPTGLVRLIPGVALHSWSLLALGLAAVCVELVDSFYLPRMLLVGSGGELKTVNQARKIRLEGMKRVHRSRQERLAQMLSSARVRRLSK